MINSEPKLFSDFDKDVPAVEVLPDYNVYRNEAYDRVVAYLMKHSRYWDKVYDETGANKLVASELRYVASKVVDMKLQEKLVDEDDSLYDQD